MVRGFAGLFGVNPDPIFGGEDPSAWFEQRREARSLREGPCARQLLPTSKRPRGAGRRLRWGAPGCCRRGGAIETGTVTLMAMRARPAAASRRRYPRRRRWLEAIRRRLSPRMPLGSRLPCSARAMPNLHSSRVEAEAGRDPAAVKQAVDDELRRRLTLVSRQAGECRSGRSGCRSRGATSSAWIQALPDVRRVPALQILLGTAKPLNEVKVGRHGLPRIDLAASEIVVVRAASGRRAMSSPLLRGYRFATAAQWHACLFAGADREGRAAQTAFRPSRPMRPPGRFESTGGACARHQLRRGSPVAR